MALDQSDGGEDTVLFDPGRVIGPDGPHGITVRAAVVEDSMRSQIGASSVAVKILPIGELATFHLQEAVEQLRATARHAGMVQYHGVWPAPGGEAWLVSELCENGSVADVLALAGVHEAPQIEPILAYVLRNVLLALDDLHRSANVHGDLRVGNILVDENGRVKLADYGVYHILESALRTRVSYPGARLWPAPELGSHSRYDVASEIWALGIAVLELVDGRAAVMRSYFAASIRGGPGSAENNGTGRRGSGGAGAGPAVRTGSNRMGTASRDNQEVSGVAGRVASSSQSSPALLDPSQWSPELSQFIAAACAVSPDRRPSANELLSSGFIALADGRGLADAVERASMMPTPARLQTLYNRFDVVQTLYRRNDCVRAPLVDLDQLDASDFVDPGHQERSAPEEKPAVELALRTALQNRARDAAVGLKCGSGDDAERLQGLETDESLSCILDMIDMLSVRRPK